MIGFFLWTIFRRGRWLQDLASACPMSSRPGSAAPARGWSRHGPKNRRWPTSWFICMMLCAIAWLRPVMPRWPSTKNGLPRRMG